VELVADGMQYLGLGLKVVGTGLTVTGVGAPLGVPLVGAGEAFDVGGTMIEIGNEAFNQKDLPQAANTAAWGLVGYGIGKKIDKIPGAEQTRKDVAKRSCELFGEALEKGAENTINESRNKP